MDNFPEDIRRVKAKDVKENQSMATQMFGKWSRDRISSIGENGLGWVIIRRFDDTASDSFEPDTFVLISD